jgi:hypothetical protein
LINLGIFFSSSIVLIVVLWSTSCCYLISLNFLLSLSRIFLAFDEISLGKFIFFFVGKGCASWGRRERP